MCTTEISGGPSMSLDSVHIEKEFESEILRNLVEREKSIAAHKIGEDVSKDSDPSLSPGVNFNKDLTAYNYFEAVKSGKIDDLHVFIPASKQEITIHPKSDLNVIEEIFAGEAKEATKFLQNLAMSAFSQKTNDGTIYGKVYPSIDLTGVNTADDEKIASLGINLRKKEVLTLEITNPEDIKDFDTFKSELVKFFADYLREQTNPFLDKNKIFVKISSSDPKALKVLSLAEKKIIEGLLEIDVNDQDNQDQLVTMKDFVEVAPHDMIRRTVELANEMVMMKDMTIGSAFGNFGAFNDLLTNAVAKKLNLRGSYDIPLIRYSYSSNKVHLYEDAYLRETSVYIPSREECKNGDFFEKYQEKFDMMKIKDFVPNKDLSIESIPDEIRGGVTGLHITLLLVHDDEMNVPKMGAMSTKCLLRKLKDYLDSQDGPLMVWSAFRESTSYPLLKELFFSEGYNRIKKLFKGYEFNYYEVGVDCQGNDPSEKFHHVYLAISKKTDKD